MSGSRLVITSSWLSGSCRSCIWTNQTCFILYTHLRLFFIYVCVCIYIYIIFSSVQFGGSVTQSRPTLCDPMNRSTPVLPVDHQLPEFTQTQRPLSQWCHPAISSSVVPFSSFPQSLPASGSFPMSQLSQEVAKVLEFQLQHQSFQRNLRVDLLQNGLVGSPCSPRDSQESSPTPQFKSINSSALSFLHSPTLTSVHDHRKNHSLH